VFKGFSQCISAVNILYFGQLTPPLSLSLTLSSGANYYLYCAKECGFFS
jgi:hypothetical protein